MKKPLLCLLILAMVIVFSLASSVSCDQNNKPEVEVVEPEEEALDESEAKDSLTNVEAFIGTWVNEDEDTGGITRTVIRAEFDTIFVHMWGACHPEDCDWGEEKPESYDSKSRIIFMTWKTGFSIISQQINLLSDGNLQVNSHTHFIDESNRADYDSLDIFYKVTNVEEPEEEPAEEVAEAEKLQRIDSLLASEAIRWYFSVNGIVQEIEGRNVTIVGLTEMGEETASLVVPVSQEAKIISDYILPEGAAKEEITGTISTSAGKEYNLGEKEINLEEIKVGDNVYIYLNLKPDYTIEGTEVRVSPVDLIPVEIADDEPEEEALNESEAEEISVLTLYDGDSYHFLSGAKDKYTGGDFYFSFSEIGPSFWANNLHQRGLLDLVNIGEVDLNEVIIPDEGYYERFGVTAIVGHTYVSLAQEGEEDHFIVFRVLEIKTDSFVKLEYVYR